MSLFTRDVLIGHIHLTLLLLIKILYTTLCRYLYWVKHAENVKHCILVDKWNLSRCQEEICGPPRISFILWNDNLIPEGAWMCHVYLFKQVHTSIKNKKKSNHCAVQETRIPSVLVQNVSISPRPCNVTVWSGWESFNIQSETSSVLMWAETPLREEEAITPKSA